MLSTWSLIIILLVFVGMHLFGKGICCGSNGHKHHNKESDELGQGGSGKGCH